MSNDRSRDLLQAALTEIRALREELEHTRAASHAPVAIVGLGCRFPGGGSGPDGYWNMLRAGTDAIRTLPDGRWDEKAVFAALGAHSDAPVTWGGFLNDIDGFDPEFFGISPREAPSIDPQQRLFLEVAWEALEDAGIASEQLAGSRTGVFVGVHSQSSDWFVLQTSDPAHVTPYTATGTALNVVPGRLSYLLDLHGPSVAIDTACSSSLVATHLAVQALRAGDCTLAIAGGVNLRILPLFIIATARMGEWPHDGRCKTFDDAADGVVSGEGCGVVVLKPLPRALADGDRIYAIIRGSAVNQDGASLGLTAPNSAAQKAVITAAFQNAGLAPNVAGYVEAHGTGTPLGDPIEMEALRETVGADRDSRCYVGSVKTNFGHLEGAAGVAGLIKAALSVYHGEIPPHLHFQKLNHNIDLSHTPIEIPVATVPWRESQRVAGVSSFGWSGTNAHVVLSSSEPLERTAPEPVLDDLHLLPLSARSEVALGALREELVQQLEHADQDLAHLCASVALRRDHHRYRTAVAARDAHHAIEQLRAPRNSPVIAGAAPRIAFLFPGQGTQWPGMMRTLQAHPVCHAVLDKCAQAYGTRAGRSFDDLLAADADLLRRTEIAQPLIFAVQCALAALLRHWGIEPVAVAGHSLGEVAAAVTAGVIDVEAGMDIVVRRAHLMERAAGGEMAVFECTQSDAEALLVGQDGLAIAGINAPRAVVISGDAEQLAKVEALAAQQGIRTRSLQVGYAFHSTLLDGMDRELTQQLDTLAAKAPLLPLYSSVSGARLTTPMDAAYWGANLRQPVRFADACYAMLNDGIDFYLEIGPAAALARHITECVQVAGAHARVLPLMRRDTPVAATILAGVAELYAAGAALRWEHIYQPGRFVPGPPYPWQRRRYWLELPQGAGLSWLRTDSSASAAATEPETVLPPTVAEDLAKQLRAVVARTLHLEANALDATTPLIALGLDSFLALELEIDLAALTGVTIPVPDLLGGMTLADVIALLDSQPQPAGHA